jgi:hypothetical protein
LRSPGNRTMSQRHVPVVSRSANVVGVMPSLCCSLTHTCSGRSNVVTTTTADEG